jgi:hypothetical protein
MARTTVHTHDEFQAALFSSAGIPAYKWGDFGSAGYHPSWLAPDGKILTGDSHAQIASDTVGAGYSAMYQAGYLRLQPGYRRDHFSIEGPSDGATITPAMRVTLAKLLRQFKPSKANDLSFVSVDEGAATVVHSPKEFLQACMSAYGSTS